MSRTTPDLAGKRYGRLTALRRVPDTRHAVWRCVCVCGQERNVRGASLICGATKSCGCLRAQESTKRARESATRRGKALRRRNVIAAMFAVPQEEYAPAPRWQGIETASLDLARALGMR